MWRFKLLLMRELKLIIKPNSERYYECRRINETILSDN